VITLKHFAQHWRVSPAKLRRLFRKEYPKKENGRWEFEHGDKNLAGVMSLLKRKLGEPTGNCAALSRAMLSQASTQDKSPSTSNSTKRMSASSPAKLVSQG
jgi:hypothetical protein